MKSQITSIQIEQRIFSVRGHKVMLDSELAELYQVETRVLLQCVKRNIKRFPEDFMFQLTPQEAKSLRSQFVTLEVGRGKHRKYLPYVFTQDGVAMLSSVLRSNRAIEVNIQIMRTFNRMKGFLVSLGELKQEIENMKRSYNQNFSVVFDAIGRLLDGPKKKIKVKGFVENQHLST